MPRTQHPDYKKRLDPYDPRTGATGNDDPNESDADVRSNTKTHKKRGDAIERAADRAAERSSPGSGEDDADGEAADIQPEDVEQDEPAR